MANLTPLDEIRKLMDKNYVNTNKINSIKTLREISGEGLRETKDFFEQEWLPFVNERKYEPKSKVGEFGHEADLSGFEKALNENQELNPPMFLIGHCYKQFNGETVLIVGASNQNKHHETVYSITSEGNVVHRYNRKDFGRVTGTNHGTPCPLNLRIPD